MKIYIGHSRSFDYQKELYDPIRQNPELSKYDIILPHENASSKANPKSFYQNLGLFIAEVSYPATGLGIELGWASFGNTPIVAISKAGAKVSGSIHAVTDEFYQYSSEAELVKIIREIIQQHQK